MDVDRKPDVVLVKKLNQSSAQILRDKLTPVERVAECSKYGILLFEYWISPSGGLRNWMRLNFLLFLIFAIPVALVVPILIAFAKGVADIAGSMETAMRHILAFLAFFIVVFAISCFLPVILKGLLAISSQAREALDSKSDESKNKSKFSFGTGQKRHRK